MTRIGCDDWDFNSVLEPDTDEVLLSLLAQDNEPPPKHDKPHRRYVAPPAYGGYNYWDTFEKRGDRWWEPIPLEEYRKRFPRHKITPAWEQPEPTPRPAPKVSRPPPRLPEPWPEPPPRPRVSPMITDWLVQRLLEAGEFYQAFCYARLGLVRYVSDKNKPLAPPTPET